jgi:hypothetical protein
LFTGKSLNNFTAPHLRQGFVTMGGVMSMI